MIASSAVHVLETGPARLRQDIDRLLETPPAKSLDPDRTTWIKVNGNFNINYPGSNTSLWFLGSLLAGLRDLGFKDVTVVEGDLPEFTAENMAASTGLLDVVRRYDVPFESYEHLPRDEHHLPVRLRDVQLVNAPVFHTHGQAIISCATKNLFGLLPRNRRRFHGKLSDKLLELHEQVPCTTLVDGTVGMEGESTRRGQPVRCDLLMAGSNTLALDVVAARVMGFRADEVPLLRLAMERGMLRPSAVDVVGEADGASLQARQFALRVSSLRHFANALTRLPIDLEPLYRVLDPVRVAIHRVNWRARKTELRRGSWSDYPDHSAH